MSFFGKIDLLQKTMRAFFFNNRTPLIVSWLITYRCNLRCRYCGFWENKVQELETGRIRDLIDAVIACGTRIIVFSGGEPLLRDDLGEIIKYCKVKGIFVSINSNGVLVKERIDAVRKADAIKLSLDGPREINDAVRGEGAHDKVLEAVKICKENGMDVSLTAVISQKNISSLSYVLDVADQYDVGIYFKPADKNNCGYWGKDISSETPGRIDHQKAVDFLIENKRKGNKRIRNSVGGLEYFYHWPQPTQVGCFVSRLACFIDPAGKIFICSMFPHSDKHLVSTEQGFRTAFQSLKLPHACNQCWCPSFLEINLLKNLKFEGILSMRKALHKKHPMYDKNATGRQAP